MVKKSWVSYILSVNIIIKYFYRRAKLLLKKKRFQEQLLFNADRQLEKLEKLTHDIEFAQVELEVVHGLKVGNEALKKVNDSLNIEDIETILDETREGIEKQNVSKTGKFTILLKCKRILFLLQSGKPPLYILLQIPLGVSS